jgi:predicted MPP superfamily phosphohydrolase
MTAPFAPQPPPPLRSPPGASIDARQMWAANRFWMETQNLVTKRYGGKRKQHWYALLFLLHVFERLLRLLGLYQRGVDNARRLELRELELTFEDLPEAFDGFTVLHLSDLHLDGMPELDRLVLERLAGRSFDLCVLTGDYRTELHGPIRATMEALGRLVRGIESREGVVAVLGNHDDCHMVVPMEAMGIRVLVNERHLLERGGQRLQLIGTDDVHYYYTDQALHALEASAEAFTVALIHSPELYQAAAAAGARLYLCGHTHAGQVVLPGGTALLKHLRSGRHLYKGHWRHGAMQGITSAGVGTSGIPVRFNTRGELLVLRLRRARPGQSG